MVDRSEWLRAVESTGGGDSCGKSEEGDDRSGGGVRTGSGGRSTGKIGGCVW